MLEGWKCPSTSSSLFWSILNRAHFAVTPMHSTYLPVGCVNPIYFFFFPESILLSWPDSSMQNDAQHHYKYIYASLLTVANCRRQQTICSEITVIITVASNCCTWRSHSRTIEHCIFYADRWPLVVNSYYAPAAVLLDNRQDWWTIFYYCF